MRFTCSNPSRKLCPRNYMVLFQGPTKLSAPPEIFEALNSTYVPPSTYGSVHARWTVQDPGLYRVYVYPELPYCSQWNNLEYPWQKAMVEGSPFDVLVTPGANSHTEGYGSCSPEQIYAGRYLSVDHSLPTSIELSAMYSRTDRTYVYAPYACKIPPRTVHQAAISIRSAQHFVFVGDSVTRSTFCARIWQDLHGRESIFDTSCDPNTDSYHFSHKFTHIVLEEEHQPRNVSFSFLWATTSDDLDLTTFLSLNPPPTHVVMSFGL
jgi:hypothetical protein